MDLSNENQINSFSGQYKFLSNFYRSVVVFDDDEYPTVEHAYQAAKFKERPLRIQVQRSETPAEAKRLGRTANLRSDWESVKKQVMKDCLMSKFKNDNLREQLLKTGDRHLEEGNTWNDTFWGTCKGVGENNLGKLLMEVRYLLGSSNATLYSNTYSRFQSNQTEGGVSWEDPATEAWITRLLYICKLSHDVTEEQLQPLLENHGDIKKLKCIKSKGIAFVEYWDIRSSEKAHGKLKGCEIHGRTIDVQYSTGRSSGREKNLGTLYVRPKISNSTLTDTNSVQSYEELFAKYGEVKQIKQNKSRSSSEKFVEFYDLRAAEAALESLNGFSHNGTPLYVQFSRNATRTLNKESSMAKMMRDGGQIPGHTLRSLQVSEPHIQQSIHHGFSMIRKQMEVFERQLSLLALDVKQIVNKLGNTPEHAHLCNKVKCNHHHHPAFHLYRQPFLLHQCNPLAQQTETSFNITLAEVSLGARGHTWWQLHRPAIPSRYSYHYNQ